MLKGNGKSSRAGAPAGWGVIKTRTMAKKLPPFRRFTIQVGEEGGGGSISK